MWVHTHHCEQCELNMVWARSVRTTHENRLGVGVRIPHKILNLVETIRRGNPQVFLQMCRVK